MKLAMKDLETVIQKSQRERKTSATRPIDDYYMHDYKGFCIEPVIGGLVIVLYGRENTLYFAGPSGFRLSKDAREARVYRTAEFCRSVIDEIITDHATWVETLGGTFKNKKK